MSDLLDFSDPGSFGGNDTVLSVEEWIDTVQDHDNDGFVSGKTVSDIAYIHLV